MTILAEEGEEMMSTYILIHGMAHGAWCWHKVVPLLQQAGHTVIALDLPGHGHDTAPIGQQSLESYAERVVSALDAQPAPVILVGHSMGGMVISRAAELRPTKIATLVYLCAYLPHGSLSIRELSPREHSLESSDAPTIIDLEQGTITVKPETTRYGFFSDCSDEDIAYANARLCPEALAALAQPVALTPERFGSVPRVYITTTEDRTVLPAWQKAMYKAQPCRQVVSMATGHSPFFSAPEELVRLLTSTDVLS